MRRSFCYLMAIAVCIVTATTLFACKTAEDNTFYLDSNNFFANWMQGLKEDTLLKNVVMPGAHDAATSNTALYEGLLADSSTRALTERLIAQTKCQSSSVYDLMMNGVRYFDLRVKRNSVDGLLYTYHSTVIFDLWIDVVHQIKQYIENARDFLVLDFQHFENNAHEEALAQFMSLVDFDKYALTTDTDLDSLTMGDIARSGKRFVVIWSRSTSTEPKYLFRRSQWLYSPYENKEHLSPQTLIDYLDEYYSSYDGNGLFVLQSQCSSSTKFNPRQLEDVFDAMGNEYLISIDEARLAKTNIVMRDFVDEGVKIPVILSLNARKNVVKTEYLSLFEHASEE